MKSIYSAVIVLVSFVGMVGCGGGRSETPEAVAPTAAAPPPGPEPVLNEEGP